MYENSELPTEIKNHQNRTARALSRLGLIISDSPFWQAMVGIAIRGKSNLGFVTDCEQFQLPWIAVGRYAMPPKIEFICEYQRYPARSKKLPRWGMINVPTPTRTLADPTPDFTGAEQAFTRAQN